MTKTALITIATGANYWPFAEEMLKSAKLYFPEAQPVLFTDAPDPILTNVTMIKLYKEPLGFPKETLFRYHTILKYEQQFKDFDQIFWIDADMLFAAPVGDVYSNGITATLHPGYPPSNPTGVPENTRPNSTAYLVGNTRYFCGGFNGGDRATFIRMAKILRDNIDADLQKGIIAIHNDESHLNHYLHYNPPDKILDQSYCYPESMAGPGYKWVFDNFRPILIAREKNFAK